MPSFSNKSIFILSGAEGDLQVLFAEVVKTFDCTILCSIRGKEEQNAAFASGKSKKKFPDSKHNLKPGKQKVEAVDAAPYPIEWEDKERFAYFAGYVMAVADRLLKEGKISRRVKWGGDWNCDGRLLEETFRDLDHFELI